MIVIFRLVLSMVMFVALIGGIYSAYKHFSGLDPLKLDPQAVFGELLAGKIPQEAKSLSDQISQKVLGQQNVKEITSGDSKKETNPDAGKENPVKDGSGANLVFKFLLIADSHSDNNDLGKAINQAKEKYPDLKFIIGLGDYTEVGTVEELKNAKKEFDSSSLRYFLIPGDHDLWDCRNRKLAPVACFEEVFGPSYQTFTVENFKFLLLDNSDDYKGIEGGQSNWIERELLKAKEESAKGIFVFVHEPLYHPSSDHIMGKLEKGLKQQARDLMFQLKSAGVKKVFAGDAHFFSEYSEAVTGLPMVTVGAVTIERNPQVPRFAVV
ncbi:metallophosphoesterase, partial [Candidatus Daviesbacteria bacterium]|nr:metallophosphoesterase [Candidatus Daviesbacteria bacterium]